MLMTIEAYAHMSIKCDTTQQFSAAYPYFLTVTATYCCYRMYGEYIYFLNKRR
jgi:hypothetical protein